MQGDYTKNIVNLTGKELKNEIQKLQKEKINTTMMKIQFHQRITLAWACFTFVLLGAPLALITNKHGKALAFGLSLILIFLFYVLLASSISIADKELISARYILLMPNIIVGIIGIFLIKKMNTH